MTYQKVKKTPL